jgi:hypothetical protein
VLGRLIELLRRRGWGRMRRRRGRGGLGSLWGRCKVVLKREIWRNQRRVGWWGRGGKGRERRGVGVGVGAEVGRGSIDGIDIDRGAGRDADIGHEVEIGIDTDENRKTGRRGDLGVEALIERRKEDLGVEVSIEGRGDTEAVAGILIRGRHTVAIEEIQKDLEEADLLNFETKGDAIGILIEEGRPSSTGFNLNLAMESGVLQQPLPSIVALFMTWL